MTISQSDALQRYFDPETNALRVVEAEGEVVSVILSASESYPVATGAVVVTCVVVAETSTAASALAKLTNTAGDVTYALISVPAMQSVVWTTPMACPDGLALGIDSGEGAITVVYHR